MDTATPASSPVETTTVTVPPDMYDDPYPRWRQLRERSPAFRLPNGVWLLTRYADVDRVLRDRGSHRRGGTLQRPYGPGPARSHVDRILIALDPPDHTRLRALVTRAFSARGVASLEPRIASLVDHHLDELAETGDLVSSLAYPVPLTVVCDLLGVPEDERHPFEEWSRQTARSFDPDPTPDDVAAFDAATADAYAYFGGLLSRRRRRPRADLLSALAGVQDGDQRLRDDEIISLAFFLVFAGHETTTNLVANGVQALLEHPDQLGRLRTRPDAIPAAIEEFLRYDSPVQATWATYDQDMEIAGCRIPAGESLSLIIAAANRDPARFPDPDRLDVDRPDIRHLAFGAGIHFCLGASLARLESRIMLRGLLDRFPHLEPGGTPVRKATFLVRGFASLPLQLQAT